MSERKIESRIDARSAGAILKKAENVFTSTIYRHERVKRNPHSSNAETNVWLNVISERGLGRIGVVLVIFVVDRSG